MTGHVRFTAWDAEHPATESRFVIEQIIRRRIGFAGLLLTDDLDMDALDGDVPQRAVRALAAGCDIALNCWADMEDMLGIAHLCPPLTPAAAARLDAALATTGPLHGDPARRRELVVRRDALLALIESPAK
jgi:beta-N-acetylhexosaminidase